MKNYSKKIKQKSIDTIELFFYCLMLILFAVAIKVIIEKNIFSDAYFSVNCILLAVLLIFEILIFRSQIYINDYLSKSKILFLALVFVLFTLTFTNILGVCAVGNIEDTDHLFKCISAYYLISIIYWGVFWFYQRSSIKSEKKDIYIDILILLLLISHASLIIINAHKNFIFSVDANGYPVYNNNYDLISMIIMLSIMLIYTVYIITRKCDTKTKFSLLSYIFFPLTYFVVCIILSKKPLPFGLDAMTDVVYVLAIYVIFINVYSNHEKEFMKEKLENTETQTALAISQIQPHFIYNTLATISALSIQENAPKTNEVINKFTSYLRVNLDSVKSEHIVSFEKELEHVKTYLWIEKMRFGEDLNIEYDIQYVRFDLPSLTIQPLVENAVKHGICKRERGGTVKISTRYDRNYVYVTVEDNGVGFSTSEVLNDGKSHVGIQNIRSRIENLCGGILRIDSTKGVGTKATIVLSGNKKWYRERDI